MKLLISFMLLLMACNTINSTAKIPNSDTNYVCIPEGWSFVDVDSHVGLIMKNIHPDQPKIYWLPSMNREYIEFGADNRCESKINIVK